MRGFEFGNAEAISDGLDEMVFGEGHGCVLLGEEWVGFKWVFFFTRAMEVYHWKGILSRPVWQKVFLKAGLIFQII